MVCLRPRIDYGGPLLGSFVALPPGTDPFSSYHRACYLAMPLYICGFVLLGASFQNHLSVGALVMGWGIAELAVMINTVAVCAYFFL